MRSPLLKKPVDFFSSSSCSSLTDVQCRNSHPQPIFLPPRPSSLSRSRLLGAEKQKALVPPSSALYYIHVPWSPQDAVSSALPSTSWPWGRSSTSQHITAHHSALPTASSSPPHAPPSQGPTLQLHGRCVREEDVRVPLLFSVAEAGGLEAKIKQKNSFSISS